MAEKDYFEISCKIIKKIEETQINKIKEAGRLVADSLMKGGMLHLFGTGHSHMLVEELFSRAGGLVAINPILPSSLMLHENAVRGTLLERVKGIAVNILMTERVKKGEVLVIFSASGGNAVPVEMAEVGKSLGLKIVAVTSIKHSRSKEARGRGRMLFELADVVIDNCGLPGDAALEVEGLPTNICATSTLSGVIIVQSIVFYAVKDMLRRGFKPDVFLSANLANSDEYNARLLKKYEGRIKM